MKKLSFLLIALLSIVLLSCNGGDSNKENGENESSDENTTKVESNAAKVSVDLADKNIPVKMTLPGGAEITDGMMMTEGDEFTIYNYEIKKDGWIMDVSMNDEEPYADVTTYIEDQKQIIKQSGDFEEFVKEEENGFIYKTSMDGDVNYDFYYVIMKDDRAIEFTCGLKFDDFTLEEVESLYEAAKSAE